MGIGRGVLLMTRLGSVGSGVGETTGCCYPGSAVGGHADVTGSRLGSGIAGLCALVRRVPTRFVRAGPAGGGG